MTEVKLITEVQLTGYRVLLQVLCSLEQPSNVRVYHFEYLGCNQMLRCQYNVRDYVTKAY